MDVYGDNQPPPPPPKSASYEPARTFGVSQPLYSSPWQLSKENSNSYASPSPSRRPFPAHVGDTGTRIRGGPLSPVHINSSSEYHIPQPSSTQVETYSSYSGRSRTPSAERYPQLHTPQYRNSPKSSENQSSMRNVPSTIRCPGDTASDIYHPPAALLASLNSRRISSPRIVTPETGYFHSRHFSDGSLGSGRGHIRTTSGGSGGSYRSNESTENYEEPRGKSTLPLDYHHLSLTAGGSLLRNNKSNPHTVNFSQPSPPPPAKTPENLSPLSKDHSRHGRTHFLGEDLSRPNSAVSSTFELARNTGATSPQHPPGQHSRTTSSHGGRSPDHRHSYLDMLSAPYPQPAPVANLDNTHLRDAVGSSASLLSTKKTLEMYRANVKKTSDPAIQYEFAIFMINAAQEAANVRKHSSTPHRSSLSPPRNLDGAFADLSSEYGSDEELLQEARQILQRLSDKSYPFAQYYLADGYASGLFNNGKDDNDRAFPLFIAASKHGHAEAGYRAGLSYEFGWGTRTDPTKAVQFYRQSASKSHPGAMARLGKACLTGDLGLGDRHREGLKWLKRATEFADFQYNSAPYELGLLHETGYGDDVFRDESYAAQLFTQSAELGHAEASYRLGDAYEHGELNCPKDPALSVHFYTGAAQRGHPLAMMALCAWYMVGAEPVLEKDEAEAYEWAKKAAECGLPKAEYAVGYFTETGIGCRRDPLEANVWYVRAAGQGDERAKHRLAIIRAAASGGVPASRSASPRKHKKDMAVSPGPENENEEKRRSKRWGLF